MKKKNGRVGVVVVPRRLQDQRKGPRMSQGSSDKSAMLMGLEKEINCGQDECGRGR